jgi:hypothetical protein
MIVLDVEEYCHACRNFSPVATITTRDVERNTWTDTVVRCESKNHCAALVRYLNHQTKSETEAVG